MIANLKTPFEKDLGDIPFNNEYPRPQFKRDSFINLNGNWNISVLRKDKTVYNGKILIPFPIESRLSGFKFIKRRNDILIYSRKFDSPLKENNKVIINFGAVDQECKVYINEKLVGEHIGGYLPFKFDITDFLETGENSITVRVKDSLNQNYAYGKQRYKRGGMWYTTVSGIWSAVWLETVPENYIESIKITPDLKGFDIQVYGGENNKKIILENKEYTFEGSKTRIDIENPELWSPENPKLYEFEIISGEDKIKSYTALRMVEIKENKICLNGKPYFFHGLLDQGYYSDGIYLPATEEGFKYDILTMKECGFNTLRKHIKIEPDIFYYYCDKYGMIVFQDFVNSGKYNFLIDTALPTVLTKKGITHKASKTRRKAFLKDSKDTIELLYNHPCVCYYTIFNEGWGQFNAANVYKQLKPLDATRIWDATSGWFQTGESDVLSEHIYFKPLKFKTDSRPLVLSEFGGYSLKIQNHSFNTKSTYGYKFFSETNKFKEALNDLYYNQVIPAIKKNSLNATILTQVSDVEDETNGLLTYDRQVLKVDKAEMQKIAQELHNNFKGEC